MTSPPLVDRTSLGLKTGSGRRDWSGGISAVTSFVFGFDTLFRNISVVCQKTKKGVVPHFLLLRPVLDWVTVIL